MSQPKLGAVIKMICDEGSYDRFANELDKSLEFMIESGPDPYWKDFIKVEQFKAKEAGSGVFSFIKEDMLFFSGLVLGLTIAREMKRFEEIQELEKSNVSSNSNPG